MPRGKPFICWLSTPGNHHDVALHVGDEVEYKTRAGKWVRAKIGTQRNSCLYVARWGKMVEHVWFICCLRPIAKGGE